MAIKFVFVTMMDVAYTNVPDVKIRHRAVGVYDLESSTVAFRYQDLIVGPAAQQPVSRVFAGADVLRNSHTVEAIYDTEPPRKEPIGEACQPPFPDPLARSLSTPSCQPIAVVLPQHPLAPQQGSQQDKPQRPKWLPGFLQPPKVPLEQDPGKLSVQDSSPHSPL